MKLWPFIPYEKIPESFHLAEGFWRQFEASGWVVEEKVHGAHLVLVTDGYEVRAAKRGGYLEPDESFFGCGQLVTRLNDAVLRVHHEVAHAGDFVAVYGELFGGRYPHPDVGQSLDVEPVQTGVWYSPNLHFMAFDLAVWDSVALPIEARWLDLWGNDKIELEDCGFFTAPLLATGKFSEVMEVGIDFDTKVPGLLGLPPLSNNKAEGVVIKPRRPVFWNGRMVRPLLKRKIAAFSEDARYDGSRAYVVSPLATPLEVLLEAVDDVVTESRVRAAISKVGRPGKHDIRTQDRIIELVSEDVLNHFLSIDHDRARLASLGPALFKQIHDKIKATARIMLDLCMEAV